MLAEPDLGFGKATRGAAQSDLSFGPSTSAMSFQTIWSTSLPSFTVKRSMKRMPE